ncbi:hypothetical protein [Mesorhizobium sp.]|uniref:hypothetical protein n=1 Tax=Mesorhizobium sp. TaxID=1871066 RepID=UPI0012140D00|nr:hypothetical protein [Mesorhizobium sp.]TIQ42539.1 MAG: hypothetical protein E5X47_31815 [Mesorhizobium sp.]TIQ54850.1 MAG: hypothetical protein E5X46_25580 [Mesorhizobium sp.]
MKAFLATIAALGLSASAASADCAYHRTNASVDTQQTASVEKTDLSKATDTQTVIKKEAPPKTE